MGSRNISRGFSGLAMALACALGLMTMVGTASWASTPSSADASGRAVFVACPDGWDGPHGQIQNGDCVPLAEALSRAAADGMQDDLILLLPGYYCPVDLPNTGGRLYLQGIPRAALITGNAGDASAPTKSEAEAVTFASYATSNCDAVGGGAILRSVVSNAFVFLSNLSVDGANTGSGSPDPNSSADYGILLSNQSSYLRDVVVKQARVGLKIDGGSVTHSAFVKNLGEGVETGSMRSTWVQDTLIAGTGAPGMSGVGLLDGAISGNAAYADTLVNVTLTGNTVGLGRMPSVSSANNNVRNTLIAGNTTDCDYVYAGMNGTSGSNAVGSGCYGLSVSPASQTVTPEEAATFAPVEYLLGFEPYVDPSWAPSTHLGDPNSCGVTDQLERQRLDCYIGAISPIVQQPVLPGSQPITDFVDYPASLDLGVIASGETGAAVAYLSNVRDGFTTVSEVSVSAGFSILREDCSLSFLPRSWVGPDGQAVQSSCSIVVAAQPESDVHGTLQVKSNRGTIQIPLTAAVAKNLVSATPTLSGALNVGAKVTARPGSWTPGTTFGYRWQRDGADIPNAHGASYTPVAADRGKKLSVLVIGTKSGYLDTSARSLPQTVGYGTLQTTQPKIRGTVKVGSTLKAISGTWKAGSVKAVLKYRWYANGKAISRATKSSLKLKSAQRGKRITVKVTGSASGYASLTRSSRATAKVRR